MEGEDLVLRNAGALTLGRAVFVQVVTEVDDVVMFILARGVAIGVEIAAGYLRNISKSGVTEPELPLDIR